MNIICNNVSRPILRADELSDKDRKEFEYIEDWNNFDLEFFRYKGNLYDLHDIPSISPGMPLDLYEWDGILTDTFFSGILIKCLDESDRIIVGRFYV